MKFIQPQGKKELLVVNKDITYQDYNDFGTLERIKELDKAIKDLDNNVGMSFAEIKYLEREATTKLIHLKSKGFEIYLGDKKIFECKDSDKGHDVLDAIKQWLCNVGTNVTELPTEEQLNKEENKI